MSLALKILTKYLPYEPRIIYNESIYTITSISLVNSTIHVVKNYPYCEEKALWWGCMPDFDKVRLILHPISSLLKPIRLGRDFNEKTFIPLNELAEIANKMNYDFDKSWFDNFDINKLPNWVVETLLSWNFDIYSIDGESLIEFKLGLDINTLM